MPATQEDAVDAAAKYFLSLDDPYQALADANFSTEDAGETEGSRTDRSAILQLNSGPTTRVDTDRKSSSTAIAQSTQSNATAAETSALPGSTPSLSSGVTPDQPEERFWCGEEGCNCSRKGDDREKGRLFYGYMQDHYRQKHPNVRFDKTRLRSHRDGPNGQKCLPMEPKTEEQLRRTRKRKRKHDS